jgi:hypothetical protein
MYVNDIDVVVAASTAVATVVIDADAVDVDANVDDVASALVVAACASSATCVPSDAVVDANVVTTVATSHYNNAYLRMQFSTFI